MYSATTSPRLWACLAAMCPGALPPDRCRGERLRWGGLASCGCGGEACHPWSCGSSGARLARTSWLRCCCVRGAGQRCSTTANVCKSGKRGAADAKRRVGRARVLKWSVIFGSHEYFITTATTCSAQFAIVNAGSAISQIDKPKVVFSNKQNKMGPPSQLSIATSALNRLVKEEKSYHDEASHQEARIAKLEQGGSSSGDENAEYTLRQEVRVCSNSISSLRLHLHRVHSFISSFTSCRIISLHMR